MDKTLPETALHAYFADRFAQQLRQLLGGRAQVREGRPIALTEHSLATPDLAIVQPLDTYYLGQHPTPEHILWLVDYVEEMPEQVLIDRGAIYASARVQEYWVVNLRDQQLTVLCFPAAGTYQNQRHMTDGTVAPLTFLDIVVPVQRLFVV
jgi:Uma2 family endonuclease